MSSAIAGAVCAQLAPRRSPPPQRALSHDIASREALQDPPKKLCLGGIRRSSLVCEAKAMTTSLACQPPPLVERDWSCRMRPLAECSEPSPLSSVQDFSTTKTTACAKVPADPMMQSVDISASRYPYSLYNLYPAVYPHFCLYPHGLAIVGHARRCVGTASKRAYPGTDYSPSRYPYSLYALYSAVYPHFSLYPQVLSMEDRSHRSARPAPLRLDGTHWVAARLVQTSPTASPSSSASVSMPSTPNSPDRLPSVSITDRLSWDEGETIAF